MKKVRTDGFSEGETVEKTSVTELLERPGGQKYSIRILVLVGIAMVFDGFDFMIVSFTMPQIMQEMELGYLATGSLSSFSIVGMLVGGFLAGYLADRFGRKNILNICIAIYALLTVPVFFVHSFDAFAVCRVMSGLGVGAVIPLSVTLVSEYAPTAHRGKFVTLTKMFMMFGWVLAGLVAMYVVPRFGWRFCYLIGGFPAVYALFMHFVIPESVHWLVRQGRTEEAALVYNKINAVLEAPRARAYVASEIDVPRDDSGAKGQGQLRALVSKKYIRVTLGIWLVAFSTCALSYGLTNWMPTVLSQSGYSMSSSYALTTLMNAIGCVGAVFAGYMADRVGRIRSTYIAVALSILAVLFLSFCGFGLGWMIPSVIIMGFTINYAFTTPQPITIEVYPTEIRATGQACTTTVARVGGMVTPALIGGLMQSGMTFEIVLTVFVIPLLLTVVFTKFLIRNETRGRVIEELDD